MWLCELCVVLQSLVGGSALRARKLYGISSPDRGTMVKTFQAYLPDCHRTYSCIHCRAHLANHDELISKVISVWKMLRPPRLQIEATLTQQSWHLKITWIHFSSMQMAENHRKGNVIIFLGFLFFMRIIRYVSPMFEIVQWHQNQN